MAGSWHRTRLNIWIYLQRRWELKKERKTIGVSPHTLARHAFQNSWIKSQLWRNDVFDHLLFHCAEISAQAFKNEETVEHIIYSYANKRHWLYIYISILREKKSNKSFRSKAWKWGDTTSSILSYTRGTNPFVRYVFLFHWQRPAVERTRTTLRRLTSAWVLMLTMAYTMCVG